MSDFGDDDFGDFGAVDHYDLSYDEERDNEPPPHGAVTIIFESTMALVLAVMTAVGVIIAGADVDFNGLASALKTVQDIDFIDLTREDAERSAAFFFLAEDPRAVKGGDWALLVDEALAVAAKAGDQWDDCSEARDQQRAERDAEAEAWEAEEEAQRAKIKARTGPEARAASCAARAAETIGATAAVGAAGASNAAAACGPAGARKAAPAGGAAKAGGPVAVLGGAEGAGNATTHRVGGKPGPAAPLVLLLSVLLPLLSGAQALGQATPLLACGAAARRSAPAGGASDVEWLSGCVRAPEPYYKDKSPQDGEGWAGASVITDPRAAPSAPAAAAGAATNVAEVAMEEWATASATRKTNSATLALAHGHAHVSANVSTAASAAVPAARGSCSEKHTSKLSTGPLKKTRHQQPGGLLRGVSGLGRDRDRRQRGRRPARPRLCL